MAGRGPRTSRSNIAGQRVADRAYRARWPNCRARQVAVIVAPGNRELHSRCKQATTRPSRSYSPAVTTRSHSVSSPASPGRAATYRHTLSSSSGSAASGWTAQGCSRACAVCVAGQSRRSHCRIFAARDEGAARTHRAQRSRASVRHRPRDRMRPFEAYRREPKRRPDLVAPTPSTTGPPDDRRPLRLARLPRSTYSGICRSRRPDVLWRQYRRQLSGKPASMSVAFSRARTGGPAGRAVRPNSSWSSTSRPPRHSASKFRPTLLARADEVIE